MKLFSTSVSRRAPPVIQNMKTYSLSETLVVIRKLIDSHVQPMRVEGWLGAEGRYRTGN
jgi:hypothetical protein